MLAMVDTMDFPKWLEEELKHRNITQSELARRAGVTRAAMSGILSGARGPGVDLCQGIAKAFKLPPEEVYRAAGILPPEKEQDQTLYRINHLYHTLKDKASKTRALDFLEFLSQQEEKNDRKGKGT